MSRAPCPNKLKTDALENSILKHMSENQGFRLGEIIRFVSGNVPSSATAMYHLFYRKLRKYIGNLKASGKIAADNRLLNRTQQIPPLQVSSLYTLKRKTMSNSLMNSRIKGDRQYLHARAPIIREQRVTALSDHRLYFPLPRFKEEYICDESPEGTFCYVIVPKQKNRQRNN